MNRACPLGCGRVIRDGHLMCASCWRQVPPHLQTAVYRTFRAWKKDFGDTQAESQYTQAADAAIMSVP
jgi:hypothetical protein